MMVIDFLKSIRIGKRCDGGVSEVRIDVSAWRKMYPELTDYRIEVTSPDKVVYIADTRMEGDVLIWDIRQSDTATEGRGEYQVVATGADGQRKTAGPADMTVERIMDGTAQDTPPDYAKPWLDSVSADANRAEDAADRAKQEVANGLAEAKQSGEFDGEDGISPLVSVEDIEGGHRVTITDKDGEKVFDVLDGKGGQGGGASVQADHAVNDPADPSFIKNRTHWLERPYEPIVFKESMIGAEGVDTIDASALQGYPPGTVVLYKVSDHVWTADELEKSNVYITMTDGRTLNGPVSFQDFIPSLVIHVNCSVLDKQTNSYINENAQVYCMLSAGDFTDTYGVIVPSAGVYMFGWDTYNVEMFEVNADTYHTLNMRYLPDTVATKGYVDNLITGAIGGSY